MAYQWGRRVLLDRETKTASFDRANGTILEYDPKAQGIQIWADTSASGATVTVELCIFADGIIKWSDTETLTAGTTRTGFDGVSGNYICPPVNVDIPMYPRSLSEGTKPSSPSTSDLPDGTLLLCVTAISSGTATVSAAQYYEV